MSIQTETIPTEDEMAAVAACGFCEADAFLIVMDGTMQCKECGSDVTNAQWLFTADPGRA